MDRDQIEKAIQEIPDEVLEHLQFTVPWQYSSSSSISTDADGAPIASATSYVDALTRSELQSECSKKFHDNPQINTSIRAQVGRLTGMGFAATSEIEVIQDAIDEIETDPRNRLYKFWPEFLIRHNVEGELYKCLTIHRNGFVEVDFIEPDAIEEILWHPFKTVMPLFYDVRIKDALGYEQVHQIPSIFIAHYPKELLEIAGKMAGFNKENQRGSRSWWPRYRSVGGYHRFIISWTKGAVTQRAVSYLRTVLKWLNKYEMLKDWEIDHKKSAGSYLWIVTCEDPRKFKLWLSLTPEERKQTGLTASKTPGSTLFLPPGFKMECKNPQLPNISDSDTDIMDMAISGLNENENSLMGKNKGTFASVKESRGPMSDRTSDEMAYFERYLRYDFWGSIFFLKNQVAGFPRTFKRWEALEFDKKGKPKFGYKNRKVEELIDFEFPISAQTDFEGIVKGLLGSKHGPVSETLGVPNARVARRIGFSGYGRMRLQHATEKERYPELLYSMDAESVQERLEGEAKKTPDGSGKKDPDKSKGDDDK